MKGVSFDVVSDPTVMNPWLAGALAFHTLSLLLAFLATRSTFRYLAKHQVQPKYRYYLFGFLRMRHLGLAYVSLFFILSLLWMSIALVGILF